MENDRHLHEYLSHVRIFMNMNLWKMALGLKLAAFDTIHEYVDFCCSSHLFFFKRGVPHYNTEA